MGDPSEAGEQRQTRGLMRPGREGPPQASPALWVGRLLGLLFLAACVLFGLTWLAGLLITGPAEASIVSGFDTPILRFFGRLREPALTTFMRWATFAGGGLFTVAVLVAGGVLSYSVTRRAPWPIFFAGVILGAHGIYSVLKVVVDRPRPELTQLYEVASKAFPSGHAAAAAASFGAIAYFSWRALERPSSRVVPLACGLLIALIGVTRVYLGVHWPTDVIGGWVLGGAWVAAVVVIVKPTRTTEPAQGGRGKAAGILRVERDDPSGRRGRVV